MEQVTDKQIQAAAIRPAAGSGSAIEEYRRKLGELLTLNESQEGRLKAWLKARLNDWKSDTEDLHRRLREDNDLVEGVIPETDYPWEGASNVHVPITEMYMEIYKSVFKRSILGADLLWYGETDDDALKDLLADVEEMMNYKARNEWNIEKALSAVLWTAPRDGLGVVQVTWCEEFEDATDVLIYTSLDEFLADFEGPEDAGLDEAGWFETLGLLSEASEEFPVEIPLTFKRRTYYGNKADVVELVDFVTIPASAPHIKHEACRGYGKRYALRKGVIRDKARDGAFYDKAAKRLLASSGKAGSVTEFTQAQDSIEGITRTNTADDYELFELVVKGRLDGEAGEEKKYLVTYSLERDILLSCMEYPYRVDFYALFKINERPNRLIGRSIPVKTRDMNDEIDTQHNQRINARTVGTVPSFKAQNNAKKELDPMLTQNKWAPGRIFWLTNFDSFEQFKVQPTDLGESMQEEGNDMRILDLFLGAAASLLSGGPATGDPNAPGNKTAMMIQQSNLRMDDPLQELRDGVAEVGNICLSHLYQFGDPVIFYQTEKLAGGRTRNETRSIHKKYLRRGIRLNMSGITVTQNPDAEMQKKFQLYQMLMTEPTFQQNAKARVEVLRDALRSGREPGRNRYLPTVEELEAQMVEIQKKAMLQMQEEQAAAAAAQEQAAGEERIKAARRDLEIKSLARRRAEENLALAAPAGTNGAAQ